ncbi:hypothetical protein [Teredinibacter sp. KSP-S5-2]|uniref:hypothetical protein n=1 Tax=Teredinibacter sp. KSP-S5-2 TaxID=3034506 RepID=UPI0029352B8A|nr:hypothetical protein [Teredinibacter sp. KSP-S5-2]WNO10512.1 hypothetical protein P5V12_04935 [Teredinibacter sp. KSP-S5-2]
MTGSQAVEIRSNEEYQSIIDDVDYMIVSTHQLVESLRKAKKINKEFPSEEKKKVQLAYKNQAFKIREYKRLLGLWCRERGFGSLRTEIRDYLFVLDDLERKTSQTLSLVL